MVLIWMVPAFGSFDQRFGFRKMIDYWFGNVRARGIGATCVAAAAVRTPAATDAHVGKEHSH